MNTLLNTKLITVLTLAVSWMLLLWVNFAGDLSIAMHFIAIPFLLIVTGGYAAYQFEQTTCEIECCPEV